MKKKQKKTPGYPPYNPEEDIYNNFEEDKNIDPDDKSEIKPAHTPTKASELDIPGSELDDDEEQIGNEDEENNYYSLGGDEHEDLEEDKGE